MLNYDGYGVRYTLHSAYIVYGTYYMVLGIHYILHDTHHIVQVTVQYMVHKGWQWVRLVG